MNRLTLALLFIGVTAAAPLEAAPTLSQSALVARALSAAPRSVAKGAAVISLSMDGKSTELRPGTNGWTCLPFDLGTPTESPLCLDRAGLAWELAVMSGKVPDPDAVGFSYMLKGGSVWSATNPDATKPDDATSGYVVVPPHVMILNAKVAMASGYPSGQSRPDTTQPFVLFAGTPAAIVILPVTGKLPGRTRHKM